MTICLFYDTETTGLPDFKKPSRDQSQPHIVQLAYVLANVDTKEIIDCREEIICPDNWVIPEDVAKVHGITQEIAQEKGVPEKEAVNRFFEAWERASCRVAHNEAFDAKMLRIAAFRFRDEEYADKWKAGKAECTADLTTDIVRIPPTARMLRAGFKKFKRPNLTESFTFFNGKGFEGAHTALADTEACMKIYFSVKEEENAKAN